MGAPIEPFGTLCVAVGRAPFWGATAGTELQADRATSWTTAIEASFATADTAVNALDPAVPRDDAISTPCNPRSTAPAVVRDRLPSIPTRYTAQRAAAARRSVMSVYIGIRCARDVL